MASAVGFSYAQAAKGRSSAPSSSRAASGSVTPSLDAAATSTSWADDAESAIDLTKNDGLVAQEKPATNGDAKPSVSAASSVTSPDAGNSSSSTKDDDTLSVQNASESTWDSKSQESEPTAKAVDSEKTKDESEASDETTKERKQPAKPKLTEAKPPAVNIWQQRAQSFQSKAPSPVQARAAATAAPEASRKEQKSEPKKKSGPATGQTQEAKSTLSRGDRANNARQGTDVSADGQKKSASHRQAPAANAPAPTNEVAWPSMETAREEERKRAQEKEDKADKDQTQPPASKPVGRKEWQSVAITPNVIFETTLPTRGATRGGRGGARGASNASGRNAGAGGRAQSLPNGDSPTKEHGEKTDRDSVPPPPKAARTGSDGQWRDAAPFEPQAQKEAAAHQTNGDAHTTNGISPEAGAFVNGNTQHTTKGNKSPRKHDSERRPSQADALNQGEGQTAKVPAADHRSESRPHDNSANPPPFREGKGSKRGRAGHRGAVNGHFQPTHQNGAGFPAEFYGAQYTAPYPSQRGGHYSQNSRSNGYRAPNMRSQSIPIDNFGRAPAGYPTYPGQMAAQYGQMQDYYGYPPAVPYQPGMEQMYLLPLISQQIEYYFSVDNLIKDTFFRKHMDSQGYVFLNFVADFKRLKMLTTEYDLIKFVCLQSTNIELRTGEDGKDRLRKVGDWERWVLPIAERDASAQNEGPDQVERPAPPYLRMFEQAPFARGPQSAGPFDRRFTEGPYSMNGMTPAFYPGGMDSTFVENAGAEELRGRQVKSPSREHDASPFAVGADMDGEADTFSSDAISALTVVVRKSTPKRAPFHTANSRTFSDGSIDTRNIFDEIEKPQTNGDAVVNGDAPTSAPRPQTPQSATPGAQGEEAVQVFWVKDREAPVDILPADLGHELYTHLRQKALSQREVAATGTCPYDMDVLYQFWSHFLIRNFNAQMYAEFRHFAEQDARERHNKVGLTNLIKFYSEAVFSKNIAIRDRIARDYIEYVLAENSNGERPAMKQLRSAWRNGATDVKNRKKMSDLIDANPAAASLKAELEA